MRSALQRSKTSASGSDMIRDPARTICIRNTGRCQEPMLWSLCIRIWQQDIGHGSGLFMYVDPFSALHYRSPAFTDPASRRARKDRRCQTSIHQTAPDQEPEIPSTPSCIED